MHWYNLISIIERGWDYWSLFRIPQNEQGKHESFQPLYLFSTNLLTFNHFPHRFFFHSVCLLTATGDFGHVEIFSGSALFWLPMVNPHLNEEKVENKWKKTAVHSNIGKWHGLWIHNWCFQLLLKKRYKNNSYSKNENITRQPLALLHPKPIWT